MEILLSERSEAMQKLLHDHVLGRLRKALAKWEGRTDSMAIQEVKKANEKYRLHEMLRKGAACSANIAVATHITKAANPDLKVRCVSNPNVRFGELPSRYEVGSHVLKDGESLADTTGDGAHNTAAYELYLLLDIAFEGKTLGAWLQQKDRDAVRAFVGVELDEADAEREALKYADLLAVKVPHSATDGRAKQLYWLVGDDPSDNTAYHLLAPLYATSLAHAVHASIQQDCFGEANKLARRARRDRKAHDGVFRDYPNLAVQKLGGTKPQNISQLNSERRGNNYLLSCAPPVWKSSELRSPWRLPTIFDRIYGARENVRQTVRALLLFLQGNPSATLDTRKRVDGYIDELIDELVLLASGYQRGLPAGWSRDPLVELVEAERLWLDPHRAALIEEDEFRAQWLWQDWAAQIGKRFGNWLNTQLEGRLPVGEAESRQWKKELMLDEDEGGWAQKLHRIRKELDAPAYIPAREGVA